MIAEITPEGLLLRPVVSLPVELYTPEREREFDAAGGDVRVFLAAKVLFSAAKSDGAVRKMPTSPGCRRRSSRAGCGHPARLRRECLVGTMPAAV